ncbi:MAG: HAMP domain-containing sensor histidine kinase [Kofleriaceae bacterium]
MGFEQDLRAYLEQVERIALIKNAPTARQIDEHELHRHFLQRMRTLEASDRSDTVRQLFDEWAPRLERFARYIETLPAQVAPSAPAAAQAFAHRALDQALDCGDPDAGLVDLLELHRITDAFLRSHASVADYALENRLIRLDRARRVSLTELGRVFLQLRGKDAIRWLLTSELLQSTGTSDPWHASRWLFESVMRTEDIELFFDGNDATQQSEETIDRLTSLGALEHLGLDAPDLNSYAVVPELRDVVRAALEPGPWPTAIRALLDDERAAVVPGSSSVSETTVEQTKLIAHEVRNALIPVRHDLVALRSLVQAPSHQARVDNARDGVQRVLKFIEQMVEVSELITEPLSRCEIDGVVTEALGWIDTTRRVQREGDYFGALYLMAPRNRLARAISNVVGNALQATSPDQPVRVTIAPAASTVRIIVDDGGPGVLPEHRQRVFLEGVTMRKDGGGSGFGLAFARRVVEDTLHGRIWCEDSDLGGACFVIELPEPSPA